MKLNGPLKLVSQLLDLPIVDLGGRWCGIVDDVELEGAAGSDLRIKALLVGPGAYSRRIPAWAFWLVRKVAGDRMTRVPVGEIAEIGAVVKLTRHANELGLHVAENKARRWIPRWGAL